MSGPPRGRSARRCTGAGPRRTGRRASPRRGWRRRERGCSRGGTPSRLRQSDEQGRDQPGDDDARVEDEHRFHGAVTGRAGACRGTRDPAATGVGTRRSGSSARAWRAARAASRARASTRRRRERGASRETWPLIRLSAAFRQPCQTRPGAPRSRWHSRFPRTCLRSSIRAGCVPGRPARQTGAVLRGRAHRRACEHPALEHLSRTRELQELREAA